MEIMVNVWFQKHFKFMTNFAMLLKVLFTDEFFSFISTLFVWLIDYKYGLLFSFCCAVNEIVNGSVKWYTQRPRPFWIQSGLLYEIRAFEKDFSFPSSHSQISISIALMFIYYYKNVTILHYCLIILVVFVGLSRILLGVHYISDILTGWVLGSLVTYFIYNVEIMNWFIELTSLQKIIYSLVFIIASYSALFISKCLSAEINFEYVSYKDKIQPKLYKKYTLQIWASIGIAIGTIFYKNDFSLRNVYKCYLEDLYDVLFRYIIGVVGLSIALYFIYEFSKNIELKHVLLSNLIRILFSILLGLWISYGNAKVSQYIGFQCRFTHIRNNNGILKFYNVFTTNISILSHGQNQTFIHSHNIKSRVCEYFQFKNKSENVNKINCLKKKKLYIQNKLEKAKVKVELYLTHGYTYPIGQYIFELRDFPIRKNSSYTIIDAPSFFEHNYITKTNEATPSRIHITLKAINFEISETKKLNSDKVDVVIVGGGITGIRTLDLLTKKGINAILIEKNKDLGGRLSWKKDSFGNQIDIGGQYIGSMQNDVFQYITDENRDYFKHDLVDVKKLSVGNIKNEKDHKKWENIMKVEDLFSGFKPNYYKFEPNKIFMNFGILNKIPIEKLIPIVLFFARMELCQFLIHIDDINLESYEEYYLKSHHFKVKDMINEWKSISLYDYAKEYYFPILSSKISYIKNDFIDIIMNAILSVSPKDVSYLYTLLYLKKNSGFGYVGDDFNGPQRYFLRSSMKKLIYKLSKGGFKNNRIILNTKVISVQRNYKNIEVKTENKIYQTKYVIITSTHNQLKDIQFPDYIHQKYKPLYKTKTGKTLKGFIYYNSSWWNNQNRNISFNGYYGGSKESSHYNNCFYKKMGRKNEFHLTWIFDNTVHFDGIHKLMFFLTNKQVDILLKKVNYTNEWSEEKLYETIQPILLETIQHHVGYFFNPRHLNKKLRKIYKNDFREEAFKNTGFEFYMWFDNLKNKYGGPNNIVSKFDSENTYKLLTEKIKDQVKNNNGIIIANSETSRLFSGYINGGFYQAKKITNVILNKMNRLKLQKSYLNSDFPVTKKGIQNKEKVEQTPFKLNYQILKEYENLEKVAIKYKENLHDKEFQKMCLKEILDEIDKIYKKYDMHMSGPLMFSFTPIQFVKNILNQKLDNLYYK